MFYQVTGSSSRLSGGNTSNTELTLTGLTEGVPYTVYVVSYGDDGALVLPSARSNTFNIIAGKLLIFIICFISFSLSLSYKYSPDTG